MKDIALIPRNVVVLPPPAVTLQATQWGTLLGSLGTALGCGPASENLPHLSLYQAAYPPDRVDALDTVIAGIVRRTPPFEVTMNGFGVFWGTFVFWDAVKNVSLTALHEALLEGLNALRMGRLLPTHEDLLRDETVPPVLRENVRRYGNPLCAAAERPHITLTRLAEARKAPEALQLLPNSPKPVSFRVSSVFMTNVGPHGTCTRILREFPLAP